MCFCSSDKAVSLDCCLLAIYTAHCYKHSCCLCAAAVGSWESLRAFGQANKPGNKY